MKDVLGGLGVAGLLCLPCLLVGGVVGLAAVGGALSALAGNPLVQFTGVGLVLGAATLYWRVRRRAACEVDRACTVARQEDAASAQTSGRGR